MAAAPFLPLRPLRPRLGENRRLRAQTKWQKYGTPALVILLALAIVFTITHNWKLLGGRKN